MVARNAKKKAAKKVTKKVTKKVAKSKAVTATPMPSTPGSQLQVPAKIMLEQVSKSETVTMKFSVEMCAKIILTEYMLKLQAAISKATAEHKRKVDAADTARAKQEAGVEALVNKQKAKCMKTFKLMLPPGVAEKDINTEAFYDTFDYTKATASVTVDFDYTYKKPKMRRNTTITLCDHFQLAIPATLVKLEANAKALGKEAAAISRQIITLTDRLRNKGDAKDIISGLCHRVIWQHRADPFSAECLRALETIDWAKKLPI